MKKIITCSHPSPKSPEPVREIPVVISLEEELLCEVCKKMFKKITKKDKKWKCDKCIKK